MRSSGHNSDRRGEAAGLVDIEAISARLGVAERFVRRLVEERRVPYFKLGQLLRFDVDEVERWLASNRVDPVSPSGASRRR